VPKAIGFPAMALNLPISQLPDVGGTISITSKLTLS
jgi:hypothetical protein